MSGVAIMAFCVVAVMMGLTVGFSQGQDHDDEE